MKPSQIAAVAAAFDMSVRNASPFGDPHYVNDSKGAELEIIVSRNGIVYASLLFEAESMSDLNACVGRAMDDWTTETLTAELTRLARIRSRRSVDSEEALELESAA